MNDYDILSDDEEQTVEPEIVVEPKKIKKQKVLKMEKQSGNNFFKNAFCFDFLPISLSIISFFLTMFVKFLPILGSTGSLLTAGILFFISFAVALAGLIIEIIKISKEKRFVFSVHLVLPLVSIAVLAI